MTTIAERLRMLIDQPGGNLIVVPLRFRRPSFGWVPIRWNGGIVYVAPDIYDPAHYAEGSCIN